MKKSLINVVLSSALVLAISGCGGETPKPSYKSNNEHAQFGNGSLLAYAYLKNGKVLVSINDTKAIADNSVETVLMTTGGFYPSYRFSSRGQECGRYYIKGRLNDWTNTAFCKSNYTSSSATSVVGNTLWNSLLTPIATVVHPIDSVSGEPIYKSTKAFDKELFLEIMSENKLPALRQKLVSLKKLADEKETILENMYTPYFNEYNENLANIEIVYNIQDKSQLLPTKKLDADYRVVLNAPDKKEYKYASFLASFVATPENFDNKYADVVNKINHQFEEDKKEYKTYLKTAFTTYKLEGPKNKTFIHNENVSFVSSIKAPSEIKYRKGKRIKIPVTIVVNSATLTHMIPKIFILSDSNMDVTFEANSDATISVIAENKTTSFVTAKSLTSYYNRDVYSLSNIDREISPETTTLSENSNYSLLSDKMIKASDFEGITKAKAKSIKMNYGYAVKYRINNTNLNKSMYSTKKHSLYSIVQEYL